MPGKIYRNVLMVIQLLLGFLVFVNPIHQYPNNQHPVFHLKIIINKYQQKISFYQLVTLIYYYRILVEEYQQVHLNVYVEQH